MAGKKSAANKRAKKKSPGKQKAKRRVGLGIRLVLAAIAAVGLVLFGAPFLTRSIVEAKLGAALEADVEISGVDYLLSRRIRFENVRISHGPMPFEDIQAESVSVTVDRPVWRGGPGRIEEVVARGLVIRIPLGKSDGDEPDPPSDSDGGASDDDGENGDLIPWRIEAPRATVIVGLGAFELVLDDLDVVLERTESGSYTLKAEGALDGGSASVSGVFPLGGAPWNLQVRVADADAATLASRAGLGTSVTRGTVSLFLEARQTPEGVPVGAGWIEARQSHLWDLPVLSGLLDGIGVVAGVGDYLREARVRFRVDEQRVYFSELVAIGSPVSLYGNGSMALDGTDLEADFIPRFGRGLTSDVPGVGNPSQAALDIAKGTLIEVQLRGSLHSPEVTTLPLPIITKPIQMFLDLFK